MAEEDGWRRPRSRARHGVSMKRADSTRAGRKRGGSPFLRQAGEDRQGRCCRSWKGSCMKPRAAGPWGQVGMVASRQRGDRELKPLFVQRRVTEEPKR